MNIVVDVDDCILKWNESFCKFATAKGFKMPLIRDTWRLQDHTDCPNVEELVAEFNHSDHFEILEPIDGAHDVLKHFYNHGFQVYALSSCTDDKSAIERRINNVKAHYPFIEEVVCLPLGSEKFQALRRYPRGSFWIEDRYENAIAGLKAGHRAIILNRPYNLYGNHPDVVRCDDWAGIKILINEDLSK